MADDFLVKRILDKDYASIKDDVETIIAKKIVNKINDKKEEVLNKFNNEKILNKE